MSWFVVVVLGGWAYACKAAGFVALGRRPLPAVVERCLALIPAAVVSALVVKDTLSTGQQLVVDARLAGVAVAVVAVWRHAPFVAVVVLAAATTALVRLVSG